MAYWIKRFFSIGRGLRDEVALGLSAFPFTIILIEPTLDFAFRLPLALLGFYFLAQVFLRLKYKDKKVVAAKERTKQSTAWAQRFIFEHLTEIRRPLQGLIGVRSIYDFDFKNSDTAEYMDIVNHCSEHVVRLINRLQLYSELRSSQFVARDVRFTLSSVIEGAFVAAKANNPGKCVSLDQNISPKVLRDYFGPYKLVKSLIVEVIDNAIRYSPNADIEVSADLSTKDDHNLVIHIHDKGPGIGQTTLSELQECFDRNASSFDLKSSGEGLGVPLIRSICQQLDAQICVRSEKGNGTFFELHLRVPAYSSDANIVENSNDINKSNQILLVEDDPLAQKIVAAMLNRIGYRSTIVSNGHDAVEVCRRQNFGFILMDLEMPVMDGWEATQHILKNYKSNEKPVIVALTARNSPADRARANKAGCKHFVPKPINRDQLQRLLEEANIEPHFEPSKSYQEDKFDGLELFAGKTIDFNKMFTHYDRDMRLCQMILSQSIQTLPKMLEELDTQIMKRDREAIMHALHQLAGEFKTLLCNSGFHLVQRLGEHEGPDSVDFISDLEQLNRYSDSLLKELSILAKHNEAFA